MNEYTLESFINYCDEMQIAEENFLINIKDKIKKKILNLINHIQSKMKQKKETKFRQIMISFLDKLKKLLGNVDNIKTEDDANIIQEEVEIISKEIKSMEKETDWNPTKDKKWNKCPDYLKRLIISGNVLEARSYILDILQKIMMTKKDDLKIESINKYRKDIGCISYFYKDKLYTSDGKNHTCYVSCDDDAYKNLIGLCRLVSGEFTKGNLLSVLNQLNLFEMALKTQKNKNTDSYDDIEDLY